MKTITTKSLDPRSKYLRQLKLLNYEIVVSDVDYTLTDFAKGHTAGQKALADKFGILMAEEIDHVFQLMLEGHRRTINQTWPDRKEFNDVMHRLKTIQRLLISVFGLKVWSRETYIILASERFKIKMTKKEIEEARDIYWQSVGNSSSLYPDAEIFIRIVSKKKLPFILMTGSDCIMKVNNDLSLTYNPFISEARKRQRLLKLPFRYDEAVIGDPFDKPDPRFFRKLFNIINKRYGNIPKEKILVVGDSERNDLQIPRQLGYSTLLIRRT